jgi:hypothetical protein
LHFGIENTNLNKRNPNRRLTATTFITSLDFHIGYIFKRIGLILNIVGNCAANAYTLTRRQQLRVFMLHTGKQRAGAIMQKQTDKLNKLPPPIIILAYGNSNTTLLYLVWYSVLFV